MLWFLADENFNRDIVRGLLLFLSTACLSRAGRSGARPAGRPRSSSQDGAGLALLAIQPLLAAVASPEVHFSNFRFEY